MISQTRLAQIAQGLAAYAAELGAGPAPPATLIRDRAALDAALAAAKGGEVLELEGAFGSISLTGGIPVTLRGGSFDDVFLKDVTGLTLDGISCAGRLSARDGGDLSILRSRIIGGSAFGLELRGVSGARIIGNLIMDHAEDDVRITAGCRDILIEDNAIINDTPAAEAHCDLIQLFAIKGQGTPRRITIRRNVIHTQALDRVRQGIFITDSNGEAEVRGYTDILVEQNYLWSNNKNTLTMTWSEDGTCVARNNTLRGLGSLLVDGRTLTERNLYRTAPRGLPRSQGDICYREGEPFFTQSAPLREMMVPAKDARGAGCVELIGHLAAGRPHGLDLLRASTR